MIPVHVTSSLLGRLPRQKEIYLFCIARQIQLIMYMLSVTKGEIKLLESFDKQHPAQTPTKTGRQDTILLYVHISNMSLRPPPLKKKKKHISEMQIWQEFYLAFKKIPIDLREIVYS